MKFCVKCGNLYYLQYVKAPDSEEMQLRYECRHCHHVDESSEPTSIMVLNNDCANKSDRSTSITKYTKYDPTIPRLYNLPCPNTQCTSHGSEFKGMPEILYLRENHENMSYVYMCCVCDHIWKHGMS